MPIRVLIADDHALFRSGLRSLLKHDLDGEIEIVGEAESGSQTVKAVADLDVDLLILDLSMPGMPTDKVAQTLLQKDPDLPIVVLTMHEDEYHLRKFLEIGAKGFVLKKSTGTELAHAIHAAVQGRCYVDPALTGNMISAFMAGARRKALGRISMLTPRERDICELLAHGHTNTEIAERLDVSRRTVESHRASIMSKLELRSRADIVRFALDNGLLAGGASATPPQSAPRPGPNPSR